MPEHDKIKNRIARYILCAAFLLLCCGVPAAGVLGYLMGFQVFSSENRTMAARPRIESLEDVFSFPAEFETWLSDHLFFKSTFVKAKTGTELALFDELQSSSVILGSEEPWLFYQRDDDGLSLETYKRIIPFSETELSEAAKAIDDMRISLEELGVDEFILYIAPDKETIYGERYMPGYIKRADRESSTVQLIRYIEENYPDVHVVYPVEHMLSSEGRFEGVETLYYKSDTHWNQVGALVGMEALMEEVAELYDTTYTFKDTEFFDAGRAEGDLQKLALLPESFDRVEYGYLRSPQFALTGTTVSAATGETVIYEGNSLDPDSLPIYLYFCGDSFKNTSLAYIMEANKSSVVADRHYLNFDDVRQRQPDVFVYEIAERYLHELPEIEGYNTEPMPWA